MSQCPACGSNVGALMLVVGVVKIESHRCKCGKAWRGLTLTTSFAVHDIIGEVDRLQRRYAAFAPPHVKLALSYLQAKVEDHNRQALAQDERLRRRRADHWERKFLRDAIGEDYPEEQRSDRDKRNE